MEVSDNIGCGADARSLNNTRHYHAELRDLISKTGVPMVYDKADKELNSVEVSHEVVLDILRTLRPVKFSRLDGIRPKVLRDCANKLALAVLFQTSMRKGKERSCSLTCFQKGLRHEVGNYRLVSPTSVCCKVMLKVVRKRLLQHMVENVFC